MDRRNKAVMLHAQGFNCAQSVACALADLVEDEPKTIFKIMEPFGFGMGIQSTCGALSGACAIVGLLASDGNMDSPGTRKKCYALMEEVTKIFKDGTEAEKGVGSTTCREIRGDDTGMPLCSCDYAIEMGVEAVQKLFDV